MSKKVRIQIIILIGVILVSLVFLVGWLFASGKKVENEPSPTTIESKSDNSELSKLYIKEYQGKIGVFKGSDEPTQILDVEVDKLPIDDIKMLESGIYARNEQELQKIIEDYTD